MRRRRYASWTTPSAAERRHECEIDLQIIRACDPREGMTRYHLLCQPEIAGSIEGLIPEP